MLVGLVRPPRPVAGGRPLGRLVRRGCQAWRPGAAAAAAVGRGWRTARRAPRDRRLGVSTRTSDL
eukprot:scaffold112810_cov36-Tisochrysis_lutea.AAC.1